jgi:hypothetical protein
MRRLVYTRPIFASALSIAFSWTVLAQTASRQSSSSPKAVAPRVTQSVDEANTVVLAGNMHPLASAELDRGAVSDSFDSGTIFLLLRRGDEQEAELRQLIADLHDPSSPNFHQWLTPAVIGSRFGPADSDLQAVTSWLSSHGLQVGGINKARTSVRFSGTAAQISATFHTSIHSYLVNGETHHANNSDPEIPAALLPVVAGISSLNDFHASANHVFKGRALYDPRTHQVLPDWTDPTAVGRYSLFLAPSDFNIQYSVPPTANGAGVRIGIIGRSNIDMSLVAAYRNLFQLNAANLPTVIIDGVDPGIVTGSGDKNSAGETYLDLEVAGSVAPESQILYYTAADFNLSDGLVSAAMRAVDDNAAAVLSVSYLSCEKGLAASGNATWNMIWEQAAAQGQTAMVSSGDSGPATCDDHSTVMQATHGLAVNGLASSPFNIAVGGTDFYYTSYATDTPGGNTSMATTDELKQYWNLTTATSPVTSLITTVPEQPWNVPFGLNLADGGNYASYTTTPLIEASGGGVSSCGVWSGSGSNQTCSGYPKPAWQAGLGPTNTPYRTLPDVSLFASGGSNYSSYPTCSVAGDCTARTTEANGGAVQISRSGGTSASSPAFAGIMALINQATGSRQGQANYILYALFAQHPEVFHAISLGSNNVPCVQNSPGCAITNNPGDPANGQYSYGGYYASPSYNLATGLGSVNVTKLLADWNSLIFAATNTTLSSSATSFQHGTSVTLTTTTTSARGTPTGQVSILNSTGPAGQEGIALLPLGANGSASSSINSLPGGSYTVFARYGGDGNFAASTSGPITFNVTPENSSIQMCAIQLPTSTAPEPCGSSYPYGSVVLFSATPVGASGQQDGAATGAMTFTDSFQVPPSTRTFTTTSASIPLKSQGSAVWQTTVGSIVGTHAMTAVYSGDSSFNPSTTAQPTSISITKAQPAVSQSAIANYNSSGGSIVLTATVSAPSAYSGPTGPVTFSVNGNPVGSPALVASGTLSNGNAAATATFTVPETPGAYTITAAYKGDNNFLNVASTTTAVSVLAASFDVEVTPVTIASAGGSGSSSVVVIPYGGFTGQVNLSCALASAPLKDWSADNPTCSLASTSVTLSSSPMTTSANFTTMANQSKVISPQIPGVSRVLLACGLGMAPWWFAAYRRKKFLPRLLSLLLLLPALTIAFSGCGNKNPGTTQGGYLFTITGTDQATGHIVSSTKITVTVN